MESDQDDFPEMAESEQALFEVLDALAEASVDARQRRIVWPDRARLSIEDLMMSRKSALDTAKRLC